MVLKLNGGLGTTMGMTRAKALLEVKDEMTLLDVIARSVVALRRRSGARLPLVLMNSFHTPGGLARCAEALSAAGRGDKRRAGAAAATGSRRSAVLHRTAAAISKADSLSCAPIALPREG